MELENVVPFGRSLDEYKKMFLLKGEDLKKKILGVGDGPASFNAELTSIGGNIISVDPIYKFDSTEIYQRFEEVLDGIIAQIENTPGDWVWSYHKSPDGLRESRRTTAKKFVHDYAKNKESGRYFEGQLPVLPFEDSQFDLVLCSHLLFLYADHFTLEFHIDSIREMLRVGTEVRIFPLLTLALKRPSYINQVIDSFTSDGFSVDIVPVEYELQRGGNQMMRIKKIKDS